MEIKGYNDMIDEKNLFDHPIKKDLKLTENIRKIATAQGDDFTTGCLLDYFCFKEYHKLIAIDQSKRQKLDADPKAMQQINFTGNLDRAEGATMFFVIEQARETVLDFSKGAGKAL